MVASIDLDARSDPTLPDPLPSLVALRTSLDLLRSLHRQTASLYAGLDSDYYDHDTFGDRTYQYHPPHHPTPHHP